MASITTRYTLITVGVFISYNFFNNSCSVDTNMLLYTIFILFFIKECHSDCVLNTGPSDTEYEIQLQKDLLADYNDTEPPNKNNTIVAVKFNLKNFKFFRSETTFNIYSWLFFQWEDPRLKWKPDDYGGVDKTILHNFIIWSPLGYLENLGDKFNSHDFYHYSYCQITNTGHVMCVLRVIHETACSAKLFDWPYDFQICTFNFGIRKEIRERVTFTFNGTRGISSLGAEYGAGWDVMDYSVGENNTCEPKLYLKFVVERQAQDIAAIIVIPLIIVTFMTISSIFLDVRDINRLGLLTFSVFGHFMALSNISENIPHYGADLPNVLIFTRSSLFITLFSIFLTIILNSLTKRTWKCYEWIKLTNNYALKSSLRFIIIPKWRVAEKLPSEPNQTDKQTWTDFASIINSLYMIIIVVIYIILYVVYIPKPIPIDQEYNI